MKELLIGLKSTMDFVSFTSGVAIMFYGILMGGILNAIAIGVTALICSAGISILIKIKSNKQNKKEYES